MAEATHPEGLTAFEHKTNSRIEAFSDIVFGFSLFNLALNLKAPATPYDLVAQIPEFIVFVATFGILCSIWWLHHRLFLNFFKPDNVGIVLNFFLLGSVILFTYPLQLFLKFGPGMEISFVAYAVGGALVYGFTAVLFVKGVRQLGPMYGPARRAVGVRLATQICIVAASMFVALALAAQGLIVMGITISSGALIAGIANGIQARLQTASAVGSGAE
jgi:uncharacterized membrane protein